MLKQKLNFNKGGNVMTGDLFDLLGSLFRVIKTLFF